MMQTVASVRAVGQVELLITLAISTLWFKEKTNLIEAIAILLLTLSIVMVLLGS
jgi:multidrug transporter EmrE-like cation transporter